MVEGGMLFCDDMRLWNGSVTCIGGLKRVLGDADL